LDDPISDLIKRPMDDPINAPRVDFGDNQPYDPISDPINDPINALCDDPIKRVLACIEDDPDITYEQLAVKIGKSTATVKRYIQQLKSRGVIARVGSNKNGRWSLI
jgi:hypothetical protein